MSKTASEYLVEALEKTGVKRIYGVVGDSLNGVTDALRRGKSVDWIHMRHQEAAAFVAGAECSHYVELISNPRQLPQILKRAIRVAVAKRGVPDF
jgi:thiamine pyrophosphate-dependent acetolactate synthase large subunit-like protein